MTECPQVTRLCSLTVSGVQKGPHKHEVKFFVDGRSERFPPRGVYGYGSVRTAGTK